MIDGRVFIDVNVPMCAAGAENPNRSACVWVMTAIVQGKLQAVIDVEIIQEILYRYGSLNKWDIANKMAENVLRIVPVVLPVTYADIVRTVALSREYGPSRSITARDLIHAAVMQNNDLTTIISTDRHFDQIKGLTRLHPQELMDREG